MTGGTQEVNVEQILSSPIVELEKEERIQLSSRLSMEPTSGKFSRWYTSGSDGDEHLPPEKTSFLYPLPSEDSLKGRLLLLHTTISSSPLLLNFRILR